MEMHRVVAREPGEGSPTDAPAANEVIGSARVHNDELSRERTRNDCTIAWGHALRNDEIGRHDRSPLRLCLDADAKGTARHLLPPVNGPTLVPPRSIADS
jgi:hypothetical protein